MIKCITEIKDDNENIVKVKIHTEHDEIVIDIPSCKDERLVFTLPQNPKNGHVLHVISLYERNWELKQRENECVYININTGLKTTLGTEGGILSKEWLDMIEVIYIKLNSKKKGFWQLKSAIGDIIIK